MPITERDEVVEVAKFRKRVALYVGPLLVIAAGYIVLAVAAHSPRDGYDLLQSAVGWIAGAAVVGRMMWLRRHDKLKRRKLQARIEGLEELAVELRADLRTQTGRIDQAERDTRRDALLREAVDAVFDRRGGVADLRDYRRDDGQWREGRG
jgi:hypothetical protein